MSKYLNLTLCCLAVHTVHAADDCDGGIESMRTELLQRKTEGHFSKTVSTGLRSEINKPVYWLHIPKCNTGFARSLMLFLPNMCSQMSPAAHDMLMDAENPIVIFWQIKLLNTSCEDECQGDLGDLRSVGYYPGYNFGDHSGIGSIYSQYVKGHGTVILRQPEQRLLSAWNDDYHSWPFLFFQRDPNDVAEFASVVGGCVTKMMTRSQISYGHGTSLHDDPVKMLENVSACGDPHTVTTEEVGQAVSQLREGFIFVGILEQYDLSMCLLHAMFGGQCNSLELENTHSSSNTSSYYDTSVLDGWVDINDGIVYAEGKRIFEQNLKLYGVTEESCSESCYKAAASE